MFKTSLMRPGKPEVWSQKLLTTLKPLICSMSFLLNSDS